MWCFKSSSFTVTCFLMILVKYMHNFYHYFTLHLKYIHDPMIINIVTNIFNIHSRTSLIIVKSPYTVLVSNRLVRNQYKLCSIILWYINKCTGSSYSYSFLFSLVILVQTNINCQNSLSIFSLLHFRYCVSSNLKEEGTEGVYLCAFSRFLVMRSWSM